jgi:colicin import membrane protein
MSGPSLQKTALLSFSLHLTAFLVIFLILRQSNHIVIPSPYTVNLVNPDVLSRINKERSQNATREPEKSEVPSQAPEKSEKEKARERKLVEERIDKLRQRESVENKIEAIREKSNELSKLAKLHSISVKASAVKNSLNHKTASPSPGKGTIFDDYYAKITGEIWQHWRPPDTGKKNIEAIVSVKISKDGTAVVQKMEKSSGNALFDRSVRLAIAKANPLSRPPYEMEIGVRFYP